MDITTHDVEAQKQDPQYMLEWHDLRYAIGNKTILSDISGQVSSGQMLAIMGPSGAGKSTMLDILAKRLRPTSGTIMVNGKENFDMSALSSYVEQHDALLGVLSVRETITFAARLSLPPSTPKSDIADRVASTISGLGLSEVAAQRIGNPIQRGISGGQKRRVTIGTSLVTRPSILLLDEPTSGLDSHTSREVLTAIKNIAVEHGMIVIASIHQPNYDNFALCDKLLLLAQGKTMYFGPITRFDDYLDKVIHHPVPQHVNPSDHALDLVNTEFFPDPAEGRKHIDKMAAYWQECGAQYSKVAADHSNAIIPLSKEGYASSTAALASSDMVGSTGKNAGSRRGLSYSIERNAHQTWILIERNMMNYSRNLLAYGVRLGMYLGMGILLATVWVDLAQTAFKINDRLSVHFFSVAFLGFMSVAGIPAFLEERHVFLRERANGLYGPGAYVLANSICTLPYLFVCALLFAVLCYWSIGLHPGADHFFRWLGILFLAVYAAESQSAVVAAALPIFVAALAVASFLNGFWMCVGGYFIKAVNLPRFWYYWAHFIDYQTYAFDLLLIDDLRGLVFDCAGSIADGSCSCSYPSSLIAQGVCAVSGDDVLNSLGIGGVSTSLYAGILLIITVIYRILLYVVLKFRTGARK